eukprot:CAMPEP_0176034142 /NCGR_PEP_ID=MMETSP0120_2-20121206/16873_1 /TAXON_ID=160619 /ORGANISM="Kryptoperidinium foliaceum, Strain CCMP 1326" /LENGTH=312 /DNA_ID=CAMNT_0017367479 /DNA_START=111 /DNA_END=1049 /DNA_ORIENTATION=-
MAPKFMAMAPCIEFSPCCLACGKLGLRWGAAMRRPIFVFAFVLNVIGLSLTIVAFLGLTHDPATLRRVAWVQASGSTSGCGHCLVEIYIGMEMRLAVKDCRSPTVAESMDCVAQAEGLGYEPAARDRFIMERHIVWAHEAACSRVADAQLREQCVECGESLMSKAALILTLVTEVPTFATNLQRSTRFGDLNCQKVMGLISNSFSFCTALIALVAFRQECYSSWPRSVGVLGEHDWHIGPGFRCLMVATLVRFVNIVCHLVVPAPREKSTKPKEKLTLAQWMGLADNASDTAASDIEVEEPASSVGSSSSVD